MNSECEHEWCVSTHDRCVCQAHALDWGGKKGKVNLATLTRVRSRQILRPRHWEASPPTHAYSLV